MSAPAPSAPDSNAAPVDQPAIEANAFSISAFFSTYLPALVLALGVGMALPAVPVLAKSFNVGFGVASLVITCFLLGGAIGTIPTGWLVDRIGRRPIMIAGPLLTAAMALLTLRAQTFPELLVYRFFDGWAAQMWLLARLAAIAHGASPRQRGRQVSWMFGMDNLGKLVGPIAGGFLAAGLGPRSPFAAYAGLSLLALIPTARLTREIPNRRSAAEAVSALPSPGGSRLAEIVLPRIPFFAIAFLSAVARGPIFADMLHLYAAFAYNLSAAGIGILATTAGAMSLPIGFAAGWLMDRFGRKVTTVPGFAGVAVAMIALAGTAVLHLSLAWYVATFLCAVGSQALTSGSIQTIGADVAPANARGMFLGLWRFTGLIGQTLGPLIFGLLAEWTGYGSSFVFVAVAAGVTALLLARLVPETGRTPAAASASAPVATAS